MNMHDPEVVEFLQNVPQWHIDGMTRLQVIVRVRDDDIRLGDPGIKASSEEAKWLRKGIAFAVSKLSPLPFDYAKEEEDE